MDQINSLLDKTLGSGEFIRLYEQIRNKHQALKPFSTPAELISFLHDFKTKHYQADDNILKILISEYQTRSQNHLIFSYLNKIFTPGLSSLFHHFLERMREDITIDGFDIWSQIRLLFLDILNNYDLKTKPNKIAVTILGRIRSRLVFQHSKLKRERKSIGAYKVGLIHEGYQAVSSKVQYADSLELLIERLNVFTKMGIISDKDLFIILATRVYGKLLKELTNELGLSYERLKKRRQRAEGKIRKFLSP